MYSEINASSNALTNSIIAYLNLRGFNVWRNNTGKGYGLSQISAIKAGAKPRPIEFGKPDSPDIIGYDPKGVFVGLEIKAVSKKRTDGQTEFVNHAAKAGAFCCFIETFEGFLEVFNARYNRKQYEEQYKVSMVKCDLCNHKWTSVRPKDTEKLECPNCLVIGYFEES